MSQPERTETQLLREIEELHGRIGTLERLLREQGEADAARRENDQRYRLLVETMNEGLGVLDADNRIVFVNHRFCELLGYASEELLGQPVNLLYAPRSQALLEEQLVRRRSGKADSYEAVLVRKDGTALDAMISSRPILDADGRYAGTVALMTDISPLREAEELLRIQCDLAVSLSSISDLKEALDLLLDTVTQLDGIDAGGIYLVDLARRQLDLVAHRGLSQRFLAAIEHHDLDSPEGRLARAGKTIYVRVKEADDPARTVCAEEGIRSFVAIPMLAKGRTIAVINLASRTLEEIPPRVRQVLESIAGRMSGVIVRIQAEDALRESQESLKREEQLLRQLLELQEQDRKLTAYEIHDGLAQFVTGAFYRLQGFTSLQDRNPDEARKAVEDAVALLDRSVKEARSLIGGLRPPVLDESGVVPAIEFLVWESEGRGGPKIEFRHRMRSQRLPGPLEIAVFRIIQESLNNARRYSQSDRVHLDLVEDEDSLRIEVQDWGVGFDPDQVTGSHFGLQGIRERAHLLGGRAAIQSAPGQGTRIRAEIPLPKTAAKIDSPG